MWSRPGSLWSSMVWARRGTWEFMRGQRTLKALHANRKRCPIVTVYGSARLSPDHEFYKMGYELGKLLAENNMITLTGAGPGLMESANRGAFEHGGMSVGCAIKLPYEQRSNPFMDYCINFRYFFARKITLTRYSHAFIALPGGYGTLDELFEELTLIRTNRLPQCPIILMGRDYWQPLLDFLNGNMVKYKMIKPEETQLIHVTDDVEEAVKIVAQSYEAFRKRGYHHNVELG